MLDVAIVSTVFNRPNFTEESFQQLQQTTKIPFLHVIVDDASDQPTIDVLDRYSEQYDNVHIIRHVGQNIGNRPSWNEGVQFVIDNHGSMKYLVTADNDVFYKPLWLEYGLQVFDVFESTMKIGIVCLHDDPLYKVQTRITMQDLEIGIKDCTPSWNWIMKLDLIRNVAGLYSGGLQAGRYDRDHKYCRRLFNKGWPVVALLKPDNLAIHEGASQGEIYTSVDRTDVYRRGKHPIDRSKTG